MHLHLSSQPVPYRGVLFIGLMIDENEDPFVVEFNVRFGDPECQVTLPLIDTDLFTLLHSAAVDRLEEVPLQLHQKSAVTVVLASEGYPASPVKGRPILGLEDVLKSTNYRDRWVNIAGVASSEQGYVATGGRVLSCTAMGDDLRSTQESAYTLMRELHLEGGHYRSDIAHRALL